MGIKLQPGCSTPKKKIVNKVVSLRRYATVGTLYIGVLCSLQKF